MGHVHYRDKKVVRCLWYVFRTYFTSYVPTVSLKSPHPTVHWDGPQNPYDQRTLRITGQPIRRPRQCMRHRPSGSSQSDANYVVRTVWRRMQSMFVANVRDVERWRLRIFRQFRELGLFGPGLRARQFVLNAYLSASTVKIHCQGSIILGAQFATVMRSETATSCNDSLAHKGCSRRHLREPRGSSRKR
jgi:hypothetical protein